MSVNDCSGKRKDEHDRDSEREREILAERQREKYPNLTSLLTSMLSIVFVVYHCADRGRGGGEGWALGLGVLHRSIGVHHGLLHHWLLHHGLLHHGLLHHGLLHHLWLHLWLHHLEIGKRKYYLLVNSNASDEKNFHGKNAVIMASSVVSS